MVINKTKSGEKKDDSGIIRHGFPTNKLDDNSKKMLEGLNTRYFSGFERVYSNQFMYRSVLHSYLKAVTDCQLPVETAINIHKKSIYETMQEMTPDKSKGQKPSVIIVASTSEDHSFEIFSYNAYSDEKCIWTDGAFGTAINVRKDRHMKHTGFFESSAYMVRHMKDKGNSVPYMLFICDYGNKDKRDGNGADYEITRMKKVRDHDITEWKNTGHTVIHEKGSAPCLNPAGDKNVKIYMPIVLHDLKECEYYVCEGGKRTPFTDWANGLGLHQDERVMNHLEAIRLHKDEKSYFDELVSMSRNRKKCNCVDSREEEHIGSSIRLIGGIVDKTQMKRMLEDVDALVISLHFDCGYLTTAMGVHEMGREIMLMLQNAEKNGRADEAATARKHFKENVLSIVDRKVLEFDIGDFVAYLEGISEKKMSEQSREELLKVFSLGTTEVREIAKHMVRRGILDWSEKLGTLVMPAAVEVDGREHKLLPENRSHEKELATKQKKAYYDKITLEVASQQEDRWKALKNEIGSSCNIKVQIRDYEHAIVASKDGLDAITGEEIKYKIHSSS